MNNENYICAEMSAQNLASECAKMRGLYIADALKPTIANYIHEDALRYLEDIASDFGYTLTPKETKE